MPRRHAGPDAGHAGTDAGAVAGTYLFSDDASTFIHADDAGAHAVADAPADIFSDDARALGLADAGAYASANTNTDAGALRHSCLLYTSPSPRDQRGSRMPSSA